MLLRRLLPAVLALLLVTGCGSAAPAGGSSPAGVRVGAEVKQNLTPAEFKTLAATSGVTVVDVRTPAEFAAGHLANAVNIDVESGDFATKIAALPAAGTYAVYCRSGNRSAVALRTMQGAGLTASAHLVGGITAWTAAGYPVVS